MTNNRASAASIAASGLLLHRMRSANHAGPSSRPAVSMMVNSRSPSALFALAAVARHLPADHRPARASAPDQAVEQGRFSRHSAGR